MFVILTHKNKCLSLFMIHVYTMLYISTEIQRNEKCRFYASDILI
jgi:hypothetical protein